MIRDKLRRVATHSQPMPRAVAAAARYPPIRDYAMIGNGRTAALIARDGAIDWLCLPRFDSAALFARLLDRERGGAFTLGPTVPSRIRRCYVGPTAVLATEHETPSGTARVLDFFPALSQIERRHWLLPHTVLLRKIEGLRGEVPFAAHCEPRPGYGLRGVRWQSRGERGLVAEVGAGLVHLAGEPPLEATGGVARAQFTVRAGATAWLALAYTPGEPAVFPPPPRAAEELLQRTLAYWHNWAGRCHYDGPHAALVQRSAVTLKLMAYAPSGAIVAAPTTSLPEDPGGERNWDYRFCWLRDAAFTVHALQHLGYEEEAEAYLSWLLHATCLTYPELKVVYDVYGRAELPERTLDHLEGYAGSRPVRVGNLAADQYQLDIYGEVLDAVAHLRRDTRELASDDQAFLLELACYVAEHWQEPDDGIWEVRSGRAQHTHSKVLCWVALDRALRLCRHGRGMRWRDRFAREREAIRTAIETFGYSEVVGSYTRVFGGQDLDAALLVAPLVGYVAPDAPRARATVDAIRRTLATGPYVHRYFAPDGLPPGEGAFALCSFWLVECLARRGDLAEAERLFAELVGLANDVGLYAEEFDPTTGAFLGNFPQAFTHVGLINAALALVAARRSLGQAVERAEDRAVHDMRGERH
jgi:GH15 family glucan-1,4-alpha-glucosidase